MKTYSASNPQEKESYPNYKKRKESVWKESVKKIMIEIKDSSLKDFDKDQMHIELIRMLLR